MLLYALALLSFSTALTALSIFHIRIIYIGMSTAEYFESRRDFGPDVWAINTKEYREKKDRVEKNVDVGDDIELV
jgi:hypothetical protein